MMTYKGDPYIKFFSFLSGIPVRMFRVATAKWPAARRANWLIELVNHRHNSSPAKHLYSYSADDRRNIHIRCTTLCSKKKRDHIFDDKLK